MGFENPGHTARAEGVVKEGDFHKVLGRRLLGMRSLVQLSENEGFFDDVHGGLYGMAVLFG